MSSVTYKASMKYSTGWTDPRMVYGVQGTPFDVSDPRNAIGFPELRDADIQTLVDLWLAKFGSGQVDELDVLNAGIEWRCIAYRLWAVKRLAESKDACAEYTSNKYGTVYNNINPDYVRRYYQVLDGNSR